MFSVVKKIIQKLLLKFVTFIDLISDSKLFGTYLIDRPIADINTYINLHKEAEKNTYSFDDVSQFESTTGYSVEKEWISKLALYTQIVIKKSSLNYAHGRVLYSMLRKYLNTNNNKKTKINILETGTARGFSSICMAKALSDEDCDGLICTVDILPHNKKIFWNSISDHTKGKITRKELLKDWLNIVDRYVLFLHGSSRILLPKLSFSRIHFAFLDGVHNYDDVMFEFNIISRLQISGDIVVFDDYNIEKYPGVVKAVSYIKLNLGYKLNIIQNTQNSRGYVIATKL